MSAFCCCCDEPCGIPFLDASPTWHRLWCQQLIHVQCHAKMSKESGNICDLGPLRRLILSPLSAKEVDGVITTGRMLSSITEEIIASSVREQIRKRRHQNKNGNNRSAFCGVPIGKSQEASHTNTPLDYVLNGLVGLDRSCNGKNSDQLLKMDCRTLSTKDSKNGFVQKNGENAAFGHVKNYKLLDSPQDARPLLVFSPIMSFTIGV